MFRFQSFQSIRSFSTTRLNLELNKRVAGIIEQSVKNNDLVLFMKGSPGWPKCGFSRLVVQILDLNGVEDFKALDVLEDDELRQGIKEYSKWPTIPQVYIKGEFVGGADILRSMHESGELRQLLQKSGLIKQDDSSEEK